MRTYALTVRDSNTDTHICLRFGAGRSVRGHLFWGTMDPDQGDRPGGGVTQDSDGSYVDYTQPGMVLSGDQPQTLIYDILPSSILSCFLASVSYSCSCTVRVTVPCRMGI